MKINRVHLEKKLGINALVFDEIDSTNLYMKRCILENQLVPDLVVAHAQTNGQGRTGKNFYSPASTGLYCTFTFKVSEIQCEDVTARVALATARAIDSVFSCRCGVKWVNDVYLDHKKVGGILCQRVENYILVGIGINVEEPEIVPDELIGKFGSVTKKCSQSQYNDLLVALYDGITSVFREEKNTVLSEYRARCVHLQQNVSIIYDGNQLCGTCVGIAEDFSIILSINGELRNFTSGYMSLKI